MSGKFKPGSRHGNWNLKINRVKFRLPCRVLGYCMLLFQLPAAAQGTGELLTREYFAHQYKGEALLIRINGFESEFESAVFAPGGASIMVSRLAHSRMTPLFQFIEAPERERQLDIVISSRLYSDRAGFDLGLTRLPVHDDRSATLAWAYQLLSFGLQADNLNSAPDWTVKIGSLLTAGNTFDDYGMEELRLWSLYFAAHLVHFQLHDHNTVLEFTDQILARTRGSRFSGIGHAALQLQSLAMIELKATGALTTTASNSDPVQDRLRQAAELAEGVVANGFFTLFTVRHQHFTGVGKTEDRLEPR